MKFAALVLALFCSKGIHGAELRFLSIPSSIHLPSHSSLLRSQVPDVLRSLMGFTADVEPEWRNSGKLLSRPEAVAIISLPMSKSVQLPEGVASYDLILDDAADFADLRNDLESSFSKKDYTFLDISNKIEGTHAEELSQLTPIDAVKTKNTKLRDELENLKTITTWLHSGQSGVQNGVPDVFVFRLPDAAELKGQDEKTLQKELSELTEMLEKTYGENCVVALVTSEAVVEQERQKRQADTQASPEDAVKGVVNQYNIYGFYNNTYPAAFNIVLFVSLVLALSVLFIAAGMWYMDPGKDSIIYRMTMTRSKKD